MFFQTLDDKTECVGIYTEGALYFDPEEFPPDLTKTWKYAPYLSGLDVEYASLYLEGKKLTDVLPEYLLDDWGDVSKKISAFKRSLAISHVNMDENCFFDLAPKRFLVELCEARNKVTEYVLHNIPKPERYEFYKHVSMMLSEIENKEVVLEKSIIRSYSKHAKLGNQAHSILSGSPCVKYNQFGTKTGRLTTAKNTFPVLTLNKEFRSAVKPQNDFFVELDFNGAEVRTLLGLLKKPQPEGDVHNFHIKEVFGGSHTRASAKTSFFAWLYGSKTAVNKSVALKLNDFYKKDALLDDYWDGTAIRTPYKKVIPCDSKHYALNYLVQSTAAELTLKQALKINYLLNTRASGSFLAFVIHDAIVLDMKNEDKNLLRVVAKMMRSTNFGTFGINIHEGKNLGSLRKIEVV